MGQKASMPDNIMFNAQFSSGRVIVEHTLGVLKSRFSSLRGLRTQIRDKGDFKKVNRWICVCLILHNIVLQCRDPDFLEIEDGELEGGEVVGEGIDMPITVLERTGEVPIPGHIQRESLKQAIIERFY